MSTLAALRVDVRGLIGGDAFDRAFLPNGSWAWADDGINWGCKQAAALLGLTRESTIRPVTNKKAAIPADAIKVIDVLTRVNAMGRVLLESSMQVEDWNNPDWKSKTGEPVVWVQQDGSTILLDGVPSTGNILVCYIQTPTAMAADADTPDARIPEVFHQYLKYAAAAYLLQLTGQAQNFEKASEFFNKFAAGLGVGPMPLASISVQR